MPRLRERQHVDYADFMSPTPLKKRSKTSEFLMKNERVSAPVRKESKKRQRDQNGVTHTKIASENESKASSNQMQVTKETKKGKRKIKDGRLPLPSSVNGTDRVENSSATHSKPLKKKKKNDVIQRMDTQPQAEAGTNGIEQMNGESIETMREKYEQLQKVRETEAEKLLEEARHLAQEERQTYEKMVSKLRAQVDSLSEQAFEDNEKYRKSLSSAQAKYDKRMEKIERESYEMSMENHKLREAVEQLELNLEKMRMTSSSKEKEEGNGLCMSRDGKKNLLRMQQMEKLLSTYRLITCLDMYLIENDNANESELAQRTEIACIVRDSRSAAQIAFDLAIPQEIDKEIEYYPNDTQTNGLRLPNFLKDDLSFQRRELSRFIRSVLDSVIRTKPKESKEPKSGTNAIGN